jgi:hypothetical protein
MAGHQYPPRLWSGVKICHSGYLGIYYEYIPWLEEE